MLVKRTIKAEERIVRHQEGSGPMPEPDDMLAVLSGWLAYCLEVEYLEGVYWATAMDKVQHDAERWERDERAWSR